MNTLRTKQNGLQSALILSLVFLGFGCPTLENKVVFRPNLMSSPEKTREGKVTETQVYKFSKPIQVSMESEVFLPLVIPRKEDGVVPNDVSKPASLYEIQFFLPENNGLIPDKIRTLLIPKEQDHWEGVQPTGVSADGGYSGFEFTPKHHVLLNWDRDSKSEKGLLVYVSDRSLEDYKEGKKMRFKKARVFKRTPREPYFPFSLIQVYYEVIEQFEAGKFQPLFHMRVDGLAF